jgi:hypothetical protein
MTSASTTPSGSTPGSPTAGSLHPDQIAQAQAIIAALSQATGAGLAGSPPPVPGTPASTPRNPPTAPTVGGLVTSSSGDPVAWTGGKPLANWSGQDPSASHHPLFPGQYRQTSVSDSLKSYALRTKGLSPVFNKGDDLTTFEHLLWSHLTEFGMDSIAYISDPLHPARMVSCVKDHARLSVETVSQSISFQKSKYDAYDLANDLAATKFLLRSVHADLSKELRSICEDTDPFPVVFMHLIRIVRSLSIERFNDIKLRIKGRRPSQYSGEDLAALANDFRADAKELDTAGQYDHTLSLVMLESFLEGGGKDNEDFRWPLRGLKERLHTKLLDVGFLSPGNANAMMAREGLTYRHICQEATDRYRSLLARGKWPPARSNPDSKAAPTHFGNLAKATPVLSVAQVNALIQKAVNSPDRSKDKCNNCGAIGHFGQGLSQQVQTLPASQVSAWRQSW